MSLSANPTKSSNASNPPSFADAIAVVVHAEPDPCKCLVNRVPSRLWRSRNVLCHPDINDNGIKKRETNVTVSANFLAQIFVHIMVQLSAPTLAQLSSYMVDPESESNPKTS